MTSTWAPDELDAIGAAGQIDIAPRRPDGSLGRFTTIWIVRVGDDLYIRSYRGAAGGWYRDVQRTHTARIRAGRREHDVTLQDAPDIEPTTVDDAYRAKYGSSVYVDAMVTPASTPTTLRLHPLDD